ncbi:MAG: hypothetical protein H9W81_16035 [Enterococcus sp.]|nr:hypothetical protein [Enterococcus sp.]
MNAMASLSLDIKLDTKHHFVLIKPMETDGSSRVTADPELIMDRLYKLGDIIPPREVLLPLWELTLREALDVSKDLHLVRKKTHQIKYTHQCGCKTIQRLVPRERDAYACEHLRIANPRVIVGGAAEMRLWKVCKKQAGKTRGQLKKARGLEGVVVLHEWADL